MRYFALHTGYLVEIRATKNPKYLKAWRSSMRLETQVWNKHYWSSYCADRNSAQRYLPKLQIYKTVSYSGGRLITVLKPQKFENLSNLTLKKFKVMELTPEVAKKCLNKWFL